MGDLKHEKSEQLAKENDPTILALNNLCRKTPEGYMITIEQRRFDGKENKTIIRDKDRTHMEYTILSEVTA